MRFVLLGPLALFGMLYASAAFHFFEQERRARAPEEITSIATSALRHPEATLGVVRGAFDSNNFSPEILTLVNSSLAQVPSFYQPPFLLASYHENRVEEPEMTRRGFEAALKRYPTNGRLHLAYSEWILESVQSFAIQTEDGVAESHLREALRLEPDLTGPALALLGAHQIPANRWHDVVPNQLQARRQLFHALARAGYRQDALALLEEMLEQNPEPALYKEAAAMALRWGDPELAVESARAWQETAAMSSVPEFSEASLQIAKAYLAQNDRQAAYQAFREALKQIENRAGVASAAALELLCGMGYEYLRRGQTVMAESLFAEATTAAPYYAPASLGLARTFRAAGDRTAAIEQFQRVLQLEPDNSHVENELAQLILERELEASRP